MSAETDYVIEHLNDLVEIYTETEGTEIPATLKQAVDDGWELVVESIQLGAILEYDAEQRRLDRQRVVPLAKLMALLADIENDMVTTYVLSPGDVIWKFVHDIPGNILNVIEAIGHIAKQLWQDRNWIGRVWPIVKQYWDKFFLAVGAYELAKTIETGLKVRTKYVDRVRGLALPQTQGKRYRRRKVSRRP